MPKFKPITFDKYKELTDLIPLIQKAAFEGLERDLNKFEFNYSQLQVKFKLFKQIFEIIQGKWSIDICFTLLVYNKCSFNELKASLPGISTRTLTDRLRFLEKKKIIGRKVKTESPLRVTYKLSDFGKEEVILFVPVLLNFLLPPSIKKQFPNINEIQNSVRISTHPDLEKKKSEITPSIKQNF